MSFLHPGPFLYLPLGKNKGFAQNSFTSDSDCTNPFNCPPKSKAAGRRPRVKSNLRAKKRNFWQGADTTGTGNRRKIRRGRKIIRKPGQNFNQVSNEISDDIEATETIPEEEEEQFVPTVRTFATTTPAPYTATTTTTTTTEKEDDFDDFFDSENDLFFASSTQSSVVFKGSPTPGGWASSPAPNFDGSGAQVVFLELHRYGKRMQLWCHQCCANFCFCTWYFKVFAFFVCNIRHFCLFLHDFESFGTYFVG